MGMISRRTSRAAEVEEILKLVNMLSEEERKTIEDFKRNMRYLYLGYLPVNTWYEVRE